MKSKINYVLDMDGVVHVENLSSWWIPELEIAEVLGGTFYTVSGSYAGTGSLVKKLERIAAKNISEEREAG